jgi:dihydroorotase
MRTLIANGIIINENKQFKGSLLIENGKIKDIIEGTVSMQEIEYHNFIDAAGKIIMPGVIDDQVHFREPGLTHKAEISTESRAAIAGGITTFMEMPNTDPQTTTQILLEDKFELASKKSLANYSFYIGATNDNLGELIKTNPLNVCGIKIFMGASTGNMLVDNHETLDKIFKLAPLLVAVHCEDEETIKSNTEIFKNKYGEDVPITCHPNIRSEEACYKSSSFAAELAKKHNTRLHILHISTAKELSLFDNNSKLNEKLITAEVCVHHLWFDDSDYNLLGSKIKWNPAIKKATDKEALFKGLLENKLDVIATDHAPHTEEEKGRSYFNCPSGGPLVQHSLLAMLEFYHQGKISLEKIVEKMCHAPSDIFQIQDRGYIRKNYWADLVIVDLNHPEKVTKEHLYYKCKWSPFENYTFKSKINTTIVNGHIAYQDGTFDDSKRGMRLMFNR